MVPPFVIPKALVGFAPILEWLSKVPEDKLNEDLDLTHLDAFLQSRYGELEVDELEKLVTKDQRAIENVVAAKGAEYPFLVMFQTYVNLTPHILPHLRTEEPEENQYPPPLILHVQLPDDMDIKNEYGSVRATNSQVELELVPTAESVLEFRLNNLRQAARYSFEPVDWPQVNGWKVTTQESQPNDKWVSYLLKVPGGACLADVHCKDAQFDESPIEQCLRTVNVEAIS
jgi:hypothetical protein